MNIHKSNGLSAIHVLGILVLLCIIALLTFGETDNQKRDRLDKEHQKARMAELYQLASEYYGKGEIQAGTFGFWKVKSITQHADNPLSDKINNIDVSVAVSRKIAEGMFGRSSDGQLRAAANGCPPISHKIYGVMTNNDNLTLQVEVDGRIFVDVNCARWVGNIGSN